MCIENYSDKQIEVIANSFKKYMKKVVKNLAIDFVRQQKEKMVKEVTYNEYEINKVSLSVFDIDTFFIVHDEFNYNDIQDEIYINAISKLTKLEKEILKLYIDGFNNYEIAKKLNTTEKTVRNLKPRIKNKLKRFLGGF